MVYDRTCTGRLVGLSHAWRAGAGVYRTLERLDASFGAANWSDALHWLATHRADLPLAEVQFWGHGTWGAVKIGKERLGAASLEAGRTHRRRLDAVRERMRPSSLWWFRTCETFGAKAGWDFAQRWTSHFGCHAAGHTHIIGFWQSGLHSLGPGQSPRWSLHEGLKSGTPAKPKKAKWSRPWRANTISCLHGAVPTGF